jgi:glutamine amidotransferase
MKPRVVVVDYGVGNLLSVTRAFESRGADVTVAGNAQAIPAAERLVIPGVGAFADGMAELERRGLVQPIRDYAATGRPLLGICLGMQLLFSESEEFGLRRGLGVLAGKVAAIPNQAADGKWRKTPHIGWNELQLPPGRRTWEGTLLAGLAEGVATYFVHSFAAVPTDPAIRLADCDHEGFAISAAVQQGRICGCQFHPEKSGEIGLSIVDNFLSM